MGNRPGCILPQSTRVHRWQVSFSRWHPAAPWRVKGHGGNARSEESETPIAVAFEQFGLPLGGVVGVALLEVPRHECAIAVVIAATHVEWFALGIHKDPFAIALLDVEEALCGRNSGCQSQPSGQHSSMAEALASRAYV